MPDPRIHAPSAERNREPILEVLRGHLPRHGFVFEVASGSGQHIAHFAKAFPDLTFQPSDLQVDARASVDAWVAHEGLGNVRPAVSFDVIADTSWPVTTADAIMCSNMIHISPWAATLGLTRGAAGVLVPGGLLFLYGPYKRRDFPTAASNIAFDAELRQRNPEWGVRDLEAVADAAADVGLRLETVVEMPANNLSVIFRR